MVCGCDIETGYLRGAGEIIFTRQNPSTRVSENAQSCPLVSIVLYFLPQNSPDGSLAQLAEQGTLNAKVRGSSPWRVIESRRKMKDETRVHPSFFYGYSCALSKTLASPPPSTTVLQTPAPRGVGFLEVAARGEGYGTSIAISASDYNSKALLYK